MKYFTVGIMKGETEYVKVVSRDIVTAINWALQNCKLEGATVSDVYYVGSEPVAIVEE